MNRPSLVLSALQATLDERSAAVAVASRAVRRAGTMTEARAALGELLRRREEYAVAERVVTSYLAREIAGMLEAAFAA